MMQGMVIDMNGEQLRTHPGRFTGLFNQNRGAGFYGGGRRYEFIARIVRRFGYAQMKRADRAVVLRFLYCFDLSTSDKPFTAVQ